jgi:transcriptional regulator of acetoin/glycerol metabolism
MSAMPLKDKTGKITGAVAVFMTLPKEKKSENLIKTLMKT